MTFQPLVEEIAYRDPRAALRSVPFGDGLVLLESAMRHPVLGRWSWLAADPFARFTVHGDTARWNGAPLAGHPMAALRRQLARYADIPPGADAPLRGWRDGLFRLRGGQPVRAPA